jgi:type I restriction enzyme R subunit
MRISETATRAQLIDPRLRAAGWNLEDRTQVDFEIPVDGYDKEPWNGITDYCLFLPSGEVLAVVEAKKTSRDPREGQEQLRIYLDKVAAREGQTFVPFGFMTNGQDIFYWDSGTENPRLIAGFFTRDDLTRLLFIRQNGMPLQSASINTSIVERSYQHEAIRRVSEAFANKKRRALLVMATGTGKTRTIMALIDLFLRTHQAQNVLFLADRDALVEQALTDGFKAHLPHEPRDRIYTHRIDPTKRLFVATEQTMNLCFDEFSPGFFDLIIFDEAHRSIFQRFTQVIDYFDARMIGLTATPANFIDRDTFRIFDCANQTPTYLYTFKDAVKEGHLVDFSVYKAQTGFQRKGIKGVDLTEEDRNALIDQGIDPDALDYEGTDIEIDVSNKDTLRKQWEEIMEVCLKDQSGQLPGKTIVFAITKKHAGRVRDVFEEMYPQHVGLIQVITSTTERVRDGSYGPGLITKFKQNDLPRIAVSVDMLDTGIDVPEVVNLVFMKPVQSRIKLWQMIGRGTRNNATCKYHYRLPNGEKTEFKIIDFWENDFEKKEDVKVPSDVPVLVGVFNTRLKILSASLGERDSDVFKQTTFDLREQLKRIPRDSFPVKKVWSEIADAWTDEFWNYVTHNKIEFLRLKVAPLLRFAANVDVAAETFTNKVERLKLQILAGKPSPETMKSIAEDVSLLPDFVHENPRWQQSIKLCLSQGLAEASPKTLTKVVNDLASQMRNRRDRPSAFLSIDLPDFIATRGLISIGEGGEQIHVTEYKRRIENRIREIVENHPTIAAILRGVEVTELQLVALEKTLHEELSAPELRASPENLHKAYGIKVGSFLGFLKYVLGLDMLPDYETVVQSAFEKHITEHRYSGDQISFLRAVRSVFLSKRALQTADLYQPPLTQFGRNAVDRLFRPDEIEQLIALTDQLAA